MGNHRISDDLKEAALRLQDDGHSTAYIKRITGGISKCMLFCAQKCKHTTGSVAKAQAIGRGHPRLLLKTDADYLCASLDISPPSFWTNTHAALNFTDTFLSLSQRCIAHLNMLVYMSNMFKSLPLSEIPFSVPTSFTELVAIQPITLSCLMRSQKMSKLTVDCGEEQLLGYVQSNTTHLYMGGGSLWFEPTTLYGSPTGLRALIASITASRRSQRSRFLLM